jgi:hypothetical protein
MEPGSIVNEKIMQQPSEASPHQIGRRTTLGTGLLVASKVFSRCIDLAALTILARLLTPTDFGLVAIAMSVLTIVEAVLELPIAFALMAVPERTKDHFDTAFTLQLARGAVLASILIVVSWPLASFYHDNRLIPLLCVLSLAPVSNGLVSPRMTEYAIKLDFRPNFVIEILGKLVALVFSVGAAWWTGSYWSLALGTIATPLTGAVLSFVFAPHFPTLTLTKWNVFSGYLRWTTLTQMLSATNWQMDQLLLGRLVARFELGAFSMASNLSSIPGQIFVGQTFKPLLVGFSSIFFRLALSEFVFKLPLLLIGALFYGIPGVLAVRFTIAVIMCVFSMIAVRNLIDLKIRAQLLFPWRPTLSVIVMTLGLELMRVGVANQDHVQLILGLVWTSTLGAVIYSGALCLLWFFCGRPDGIETKVIEFLSRRLYRVIQYRS